MKRLLAYYCFRHAVINLDRNDVEMPPELATSLLNALSESKRARAAVTMKFSDRLAAEREEMKLEISGSSIAQRAQALEARLKVRRPEMSLRLVNGYYKILERSDEREAEENEGDRPKQRIETVYNGAPVQGWWPMLKRIASGRMGQTKDLEHYPIKGVNLFFEQGKTYLLLGAPRSGKSTLLRLIAGILAEDRDHEVGGEVKLNKFGPKSEEIVWSNLVGYIDQIDRLHPNLTVKETCEFAWRCRTGGSHRLPMMPINDPGVDEEVKRLDESLYAVNAVLEGMGLARVKDTFVGDEQKVRGVSGGEKKRVTVSEMIVGGFPVLCMDEISTGLDGRCHSSVKRWEFRLSTRALQTDSLFPQLLPRTIFAEFLEK
jgi:ABC-type lipoprotein export system ATPase subunit